MEIGLNQEDIVPVCKTNPVRFYKAMTGSLVLHAVLVTLFMMLWKGAAPIRPEKPIVPVELVWFKDNKKVMPVPENPDLLAQINHIAENKSEPTHSPPKTENHEIAKQSPIVPKTAEPPTAMVSLPPQTVATQGEDNTSNPALIAPVMPSASPIQQKIEKKKTISKPSDQENKIKNKDPRENTKTTRKEPRSLDLSPSFAEISRWDQEKNERHESANGREQTLDLNTSQVRYAVYFARLKERIEQAWVYPQRAKNFNLSGNLLVKFTIGRDGSLLGVNLVRSSGETILDNAALNALKTAAPFAPLPDIWQLDRVNVMTTFEYIHSKKLWKR
ncbi:MAG: energy transducer TonB [Magnetococcales bacterium]|nr:energy transducer TonB [Magnetococcales bacterium]